MSYVHSPLSINAQQNPAGNWQSAVSLRQQTAIAA